MNRVLIVDDALDLGRLLKTALTLIDPAMPVQVVPSAEEALLEASRQAIDLLVTDIRLPGMSGMELVEKIRIRIPGLKVVMITGLTDDNLLKQAQSLKVDEFLFKPMAIPEFIEAVRRCLGVQSPVATYPEEKPETGIRITDRLVELRQKMDAYAVILLNERGREIAKTGEFPEAEFEDRWVQPLMTAFSTSARLSALLGQSVPDHVLYFRGTSFNLVLCPLSDYALILAIHSDPDVERVGKVFEEVLQARLKLVKMLVELGVMKESALPQVVQVETLVEVPEEEDHQSQPLPDKLEKALRKPSRLKPEEVDSFWESAAQEAKSAPAGPGSLTYDQARQLGLTPEDEN